MVSVALAIRPKSWRHRLRAGNWLAFFYQTFFDCDRSWARQSSGDLAIRPKSWRHRLPKVGTGGIGYEKRAPQRREALYYFCIRNQVDCGLRTVT